MATQHPQLRLSSDFVPTNRLGFVHAVAALPAPCPRRCAAHCRPEQLSIRAAQRGTQFFRFVSKPDDEAPAKSRGTQIIRGRDSQGRKGTKKLVNTKPEEVPASPPGLFDGLAKLPFAGLFFGRQADPRMVFVAGATGLTGSRLVLELLGAGFSVRAGVEDASSAQGLSDLAAQYRLVVGAEKAKRLSFVEFSTSDAEFTTQAIGSAGKVVVALGPGEGGPKAGLAPRQALVLVQAAQQARAPYLCLVAGLSLAEEGATRGGGGGGGFLGALFGFLGGLAKKGPGFGEVLERVVDSSLSFTVLRVGDAAPDSFAATTNLVVAPEGKIEPGTISKLQVAQLVAQALANVDLARDKIFDVVARDDVVATPVSELLQSIPVDGRRTAKEAARAKAKAEAKEKEFREAAEAEARAVAAEAKAAAESLASLEAEAKRIAAEEAKVAAVAARAQAKAQAATDVIGDITRSLKEVGSSSGGDSGPQLLPKSVIPSFASLVPDIPAPTPSSVAAAAAAAAAAASSTLRNAVPSISTSSAAPSTEGASKQRRQLRQRPSRPAPAASKPAVKPEAPAPPPKKEKLFGGLLEQETIYIDAEDGDF